MPSPFRYQDDYIIGGPASARVTPTFQLSEYFEASGKVHMHRELVAAVQVLRSALGRTVDITSVAPANGLGEGLGGRFVWVRSDAPSEVAAAATRLVKEGWFARVEVRGDEVYLEMPDPARPPPIPAESALDRAIAVTAAFETSGDPYLQVTEAGKTSERSNPSLYLLRNAAVAGMEKYLS